MYITIKEAAEYLSISESMITNMIHEKRIRAVHDGNQFLINKDQFNDHLEQIDKAKKIFEEWRNETIPESVDVKDED